MFTLGKVLIRQTWRTASSASGKQLLIVTPLGSARALEPCLLHSRISAKQTNSRFLSVLKSDSVECEDEDQSPGELIVDDIARVYKDIMGLLRKNINNEEMHDIATKFYHDLGENNCNVVSQATILLTKALNYHLHKDGTMTDKQIKLAVVLDLIQSTLLVRDDLVDNSKTRRGVPTAHTLWHPMKVIFTLNQVLAICVSEAVKLGNKELVAACQTYKYPIKAQFIIKKLPLDDDIVSKYLLVQDLNAGSLFKYLFKAVARNAGATESLVDIVCRFGYDVGMCFNMVDDVGDLEDDLREGATGGPVIFALREYPELKEMMLRQFGQEGDVERALELVNNSKGLEEIKVLIKRHYSYAIAHLNEIADSPYRNAIRKLCGLCLLKMDNISNYNYELEV